MCKVRFGCSVKVWMFLPGVAVCVVVYWDKEAKREREGGTRNTDIRRVKVRDKIRYGSEMTKRGKEEEVIDIAAEDVGGFIFTVRINVRGSQVFVCKSFWLNHQCVKVNLGLVR